MEGLPGVRDTQAAQLETLLDEVTAVRLGTMLNETFEHHGFCVRDLDMIEAQDAE